MLGLRTSMLALFSLGSSLLPQEWSLELDKEGIVVYTREYEGSSLDEFKAITTLDYPINEVVATLKDASAVKEWSPNTSESKLIKTEGNVQYRYTINDAPFPIDDRDSYIKLTFTESATQVKIDITAVPDYGPHKDDYVRITESTGHYLLEKIGSSKTKITYQLHAEPGGSIPGWLANAASTDVPFNALRGLRKYMED